MLRTWTNAASVLPKSEPPYKEWHNMCRQLKLDAKNLPARLDAMDQVLDSLEEAADSLKS
jgi:hypothetical protein